MSARQAVIFDLGGVLLGVDFARACARLEAVGAAPAAKIAEAIRSGADKLGFDTGRLNPEEFALRFCAAVGARMPYEAFAEIWCDIFSENSEVTAVLDEVGAHADLLLLSNTDPLHIAYVRRNFGFLAKFRHLVLSYEVGCAKPAPRIFQRALGLAAPGSRPIYFDDVPEYVAAARACGLHAQQFTDAAALRRDLQAFGVL